MNLGDGPVEFLPGERAVRCSAKERHLCAATIYHAALQGRLSRDETEWRLGRVHTCVRRDELDELLTDLPGLDEMYDGWGRIAGLVRLQFRRDLGVTVGRAPAAGRTRLEAWAAVVLVAAIAVVGLVLIVLGLATLVP